MTEFDKENDQLLTSFDTPEPEVGDKMEAEVGGEHTTGGSVEGGGGGNAQDDRLLFSVDDYGQTETAAIDRNIHNAIAGSSNNYLNPSDNGYGDILNAGSSSAGSSSAALVTEDLESQGPFNGGRLTHKQRIMNVLNRLVPVRQTYERINNGLTTGRMQANLPGRFVGQGTDGVFRNLMAKPDTESNRLEVETHPPTYDEAAADATPEYWELTVISPMYEDEVFVEGLPVGNVANFVWNALVSVAFQFVGFVLCYLLHTSHAAKQGSRAGLGITFIVYGYSMIPSNFGHADSVPQRFQPSDPNNFEVNTNEVTSSSTAVDKYTSGLFEQHTEELSELFENNTPYFAYGIIAFGLFMILKALVDYWRVKQMEKVILAPQAAGLAETVNQHELGHSEEAEVED